MSLDFCDGSLLFLVAYSRIAAMGGRTTNGRYLLIAFVSTRVNYEADLTPNYFIYNDTPGVNFVNIQKKTAAPKWGSGLGVGISVPFLRTDEKAWWYNRACLEFKLFPAAFSGFSELFEGCSVRARV